MTTTPATLPTSNCQLLTQLTSAVAPGIVGEAVTGTRMVREAHTSRTSPLYSSLMSVSILTEPVL